MQGGEEMGLKNLENLKFVDANPEEMEIHILKIVEGLLKRKLARADIIIKEI